MGAAALAVLVSGSRAQGSAADWSWIPPDLQALVKPNARDVPPYPEPPDSLMQVARWPLTRVFDGKVYSLKYRASSSDVTKDVTTLAEVPQGWSYSAHYEREGGWRGPSYTWHADGSLAARGYYDSGNVDPYWAYDRNGNLRRYSFAVKESSLGSMAIVEYFAVPSGDLVALNFDNKFYWMGAEVSSGELTLQLEALRREEKAHGPPIPPPEPPSGAWRHP